LEPFLEHNKGAPHRSNSQKHLTLLNSYGRLLVFLANIRITLKRLRAKRSSLTVQSFSDREHNFKSIDTRSQGHKKCLYFISVCNELECLYLASLSILV